MPPQKTTIAPRKGQSPVEEVEVEGLTEDPPKYSGFEQWMSQSLKDVQSLMVARLVMKTSLILFGGMAIFIHRGIQKVQCSIYN